MRTLQDWFNEYSVSHQNKTNKAIHYICVPAIFFSIVGLLMSIPNEMLNFLPSFLASWAFITLCLISIFYFRLSAKMGIQIVLFSLACLLLNYYIGQQVSLWKFSLLIFGLAWIGQFYGHKVEGKKPSFFKDLQFLLIGPAWVIHSIFNGK
jgi:uncharacterized membrane protein YGL010W